MAGQNAMGRLLSMSKYKRPLAQTSVQAAVGERIRWARELVFRTQKSCADAIGADQTTLSKIESGARAPSIFNIIELATRLRVSTDFLLRGLLTARTDEEMAGRLAAMHPELVLQRANMDPGTDTDLGEGRPRQPRTRGAQKPSVPVLDG